MLSSTSWPPVTPVFHSLPSTGCSGPWVSRLQPNQSMWQDLGVGGRRSLQQKIPGLSRRSGTPRLALQACGSPDQPGSLRGALSTC